MPWRSTGPRRSGVLEIPRQLDLDETKAITAPILRRVLWAMAVVPGLFVIHHPIGFHPSFAAFIGLGIAVARVRPDPEHLLKQAGWPVPPVVSALDQVLDAASAAAP